MLVTFLLKKKKKFINKSVRKEPLRRVMRWSSRYARKIFKRSARMKNINLQKKKTKIITDKGGRRYKKFLTPVSPLDTVRTLGDARPVMGMVGLQCLSACKLNFSTMIGIKKKSNILKKHIQVWFRKYPDHQLTRKSTGHRMGKGKGKFSARVAIYKKGEIILEIAYVDMGVFDNYFRAILKTLPVPVKKIYKSSLFFNTQENAFSNIKNFKRHF